jgi:hypothetical protein
LQSSEAKGFAAAPAMGNLAAGNANRGNADLDQGEKMMPAAVIPATAPKISISWQPVLSLPMK